MKPTISLDSKTCKRYAEVTYPRTPGVYGLISNIEPDPRWTPPATTKKQDQRIRAIAECGIEVHVSESGKLTVRIQSRTHCRRCGSRIVDKFCKDVTCPYHDHKQDWDYEREAK